MSVHMVNIVAILMTPTMLVVLKKNIALIKMIPIKRTSLELSVRIWILQKLERRWFATSVAKLATSQASARQLVPSFVNIARLTPTIAKRV